MAGKYEVLYIGTPEKSRLMNPSEVLGGILYRQYDYEPPRNGQIKVRGSSRLVFQPEGSDQLIPVLYRAEDPRYLNFGNFITCTVLWEQRENGKCSILPNVAVFEFHSDSASVRQVGEFEGLWKESYPKNLIVFPTPSKEGEIIGHFRPMRKARSTKDLPKIREIVLPNWGKPERNYLSEAWPRRDIAKPGRTTEVVGDSTAPFLTDKGWMAFFHSATSKSDPLRFYEQWIWGYDPETWEVIWVTRMPLVTIKDCPVKSEFWWVKNAVYICSAKCIGETIHFLVCFGDYVICRGQISLDEVMANRVKVRPGEVIVIESSFSNLR